MDFFGARYFSGAQRQFTSADQPFADQGPSDPQSWNLYNYPRNILYGSTFDKAIEGDVQMVRSGGATQAAADFDAVVSANGAQLRTYGTVKSATLADGSEVTVRRRTKPGRSKLMLTFNGNEC